MPALREDNSFPGEHGATGEDFSLWRNCNGEALASSLVNPTVLTPDLAISFLLSLFVSQSRIPTDTLSLVGQSDGPAQEAGGLPQVTGAGVGHPVVATQVLFRGGGLRADPVTGHTVGVIGLVHHTRGASWTEDIPAGLCNSEGDTLAGSVRSSGGRIRCDLGNPQPKAAGEP